MASAKKLFGTFILIALLVVSVSAIAVESKIIKKVGSEKKGNTEKIDKSSTTKITGTKKVIKKDSEKQTSQSAPIQKETPRSTVVKNNPLVGILPITANLIFTEPAKTNPIKLPSPPDRLDAVNGGSAASLAYSRIFMKSRTIVPFKKIFPDVVSAIGNDKHILIQLSKIPTTSEKEQLKSEGINLLYHIPENAWVVSVSVPIKNLEKRKDITFIDRLFPSDRIEPSLLSHGLAEWSKNPDGTATITVLFFEDVSQSDARAVIEKYGTVLSEPAYKGRNLWTVKISEAKISQILNEGAVAYLDNVPPKPVPLMDIARPLVGIDEVQVPPYNLDGSGVVIAQWDDGQPTHIDFKTNGVDPLRVFPGSDNPTTPNFHSTRVAGIMIGDGYNSMNQGGTSANQWRGVAPRATLYYYDALSIWSGAELEHATSPAVNAILSQNSWNAGDPTNCNGYGEYRYESDDYDNVVNGGLSTGKKLIVVFAVGNEQDDKQTNCGTPYDSIMSGGQTSKNTLVVGAVDKNDETLWAQSSIGPTDDGRLKPELVAPGTSIKTTTSTIPDGYSFGSGTSYSSPVVSGIIALMFQDWRTVSHIGQPDPVPSTVKAILLHTAKDKETTGPDYKTGYGLVQAKNAIDKIREDTPAYDVILDNIEIPNTGENKTYKMIVANPTEVKVTLVWDDVPTSELASPTLVNDLDLIVVEPDGITMHYPWTLDPTNPANSAVQTQPNTVDNVEQVVVSTPTGEWKVVIKGTTVPYAPEQFSLVTSHPLTLVTPPQPPTLDYAEVSGSASWPDIKIKFQASPDEVSGNVDKYEIQRATSLSGTYTKIGEVLPPFTNHEYTDSGAGDNVDTNNYFYKVFAVNKGGSNAATRIAAKYTRQIRAGRDLVSLPIIPSNTDTKDVFKTLTSLETARTPDPANPPSWLGYWPIKGADSYYTLRNVDNKIGVWVNTNAADYLTVAGYVPDTMETQIQLAYTAGWDGYNLVSYPSFSTTRTVLQAFNGISYHHVEGFDPTAGPYYLKVMGANEVMQTGYGYWIKASSAATWNVPIE